MGRLCHGKTGLRLRRYSVVLLYRYLCLKYRLKECTKELKTSDFDFELPEELIAQTPLQRRDASRLLVLDKTTGQWRHRRFYDLPALLRPGDCLVLNDSRVLPARLIGHREPGGGVCEVLLLIDRGDKTWECLVRPGKKMRRGARLSFGNGELTAQVVWSWEGGNRLSASTMRNIPGGAGAAGKMPLPPYIKTELQDRERYQTVYSKVTGSAAAPTAGSAFYPRASGKNPGDGRVSGLCDSPCGPWDFQACKGRRHYRSRDAF